MELLNNRYLTEKECSELTGIKLSTLRNHRFMGKGIPYTKLSKSVRYSLSEVIDYFEARKVMTDDK